MSALGSIGEAAVAAEFVAAGFHVFLPAFFSPFQDMIVELNGKLQRVQVKTSSGENKCVCFEIRHRNAQVNSYDSHIDWLAFHSPYHKATAFIKPEDVGSAHVNLWFCDPEDEATKQNRRYAKDYPITRILEECQDDAHDKSSDEPSSD